MPKCPECDKPCQDGRALAVHWGHKHDGELPDDVDTSMSEEHRQRISEALTDNPNHPMKDPEIAKRVNGNRGPLSEEHKQKLSKTSPLNGLTGEDHPAYGQRGNGRVENDVTGNVLRNEWESSVDTLLFSSAIDHCLTYEYEPETFELEGYGTYTPDFIVNDDYVVEVKGWSPTNEREKLFVEQYPDYLLIVVGHDLGVGYHIPWEDRERLLAVVSGADGECAHCGTTENVSIYMSHGDCTYDFLCEDHWK